MPFAFRPSPGGRRLPLRRLRGQPLFPGRRGLIRRLWATHSRHHLVELLLLVGGEDRTDLRLGIVDHFLVRRFLRLHVLLELLDLALDNRANLRALRVGQLQLAGHHQHQTVGHRFRVLRHHRHAARYAHFIRPAHVAGAARSMSAETGPVAAPAVMIFHARAALAPVAGPVLIAASTAEIVVPPFMAHAALVVPVAITVATIAPLMMSAMVARAALFVLLAVMIGDDADQDQQQNERVEDKADPGQCAITLNDDRAVDRGGSGVGHRMRRGS
jgi:hypothetical protein